MNYSFLFILAAIIFWGIWGFMSKVGIEKIGIQSIFWINITGTIITVLFLTYIGQITPLKRDISGILISLGAGTAAGLAATFFYLALSKRPAGYTVVLTALYPLVTILLSTLFLKEPLPLAKIVGIGMAIGALILLNL